MRLDIVAIGRLKSGPEAQLCADYVARASRTGRAIKLGPVTVTELEPKSPITRDSAAQALRKATPLDAVQVLFDERGQAPTSTAIAQSLERWRDSGRASVVFWIGGADGVDETLRAQADHIWAFGPQTWPHKLVRVMACEQIYRATSLLTGSPYHRV